MGFAERLRELDKSMKEKKKAKAAAEAAKLEAAKKAQEELFRGMSKAGVTGYNKKGEGEFSLSSYSIVTNALPPARMVPPFPEEITPFSARIRFIAPNTNGNIIEELSLIHI